MKKVIMTITMVGLLVLAVPSAVPASAEPAGAGSDIQVYVDDEKVIFDVQPVVSEQRVLAPMRAVLDSLGYHIDWDQQNMTVAATHEGDTEIVHVIGTDQVLVNNQSMTMDVPSFAVEGRTMVPLRFFSEILGYDVKWSATENAAYIATAAPVGITREKYMATYYFPMAAGNKWDLTNGGIEDCGYRLEILYASDPYYQAWFEITGMSEDVIVYENRPEAVKVIFSEIQEGSDPDYPLSYWAALDLVKQEGFTSNKEETVLQGPVDAGITWSDGYSDYRIVSVDETVETPAGTFAGCAKVERSGSDSATVVYDYYAPGIGPVCREYMMNGQPLFKPSLLESFTIN